MKDLLGYFRLTCNPRDEEAFKRVVNYPARGIGKTTVDKLMVAAENGNCPSGDTLLQHLHELGFHEGTKRRLVDFVTMVRSFQTMLEGQSAHQLGEYIARTTGLLQDLYADRTPEGISRYENIQELLNGMKEFSEGNEGTDTPRTLPDFPVDVACSPTPTTTTPTTRGPGEPDDHPQRQGTGGSPRVHRGPGGGPLPQPDGRADPGLTWRRNAGCSLCGP